MVNSSPGSGQTLLKNAHFVEKMSAFYVGGVVVYIDKAIVTGHVNHICYGTMNMWYVSNKKAHQTVWSAVCFRLWLAVITHTPKNHGKSPMKLLSAPKIYFNTGIRYFF